MSKNNNGRRPPLPFGLPPGVRLPPAGQRAGGPGGAFDPRIKAAFEAQNREIARMGEAFNTMRLFVIALIEKLSPEEKKVVLSATRCNEIGEQLKVLGVNVENPAGSEDVTLTINTIEETTMSVAMNEEASLQKNSELPPPPTAEEVMAEFPTSCVCGHLNTVHIGRVGHCKASDNGTACDCREFVEKKIVV